MSFESAFWYNMNSYSFQSLPKLELRPFTQTLFRDLTATLLRMKKQIGFELLPCAGDLIRLHSSIHLPRSSEKNEDQIEHDHLVCPDHNLNRQFKIDRLSAHFLGLVGDSFELIDQFEDRIRCSTMKRVHRFLCKKYELQQAHLMTLKGLTLGKPWAWKRSGLPPPPSPPSHYLLEMADVAWVMLKLLDVLLLKLTDQRAVPFLLLSEMGVDRIQRCLANIQKIVEDTMPVFVIGFHQAQIGCVVDGNKKIFVFAKYCFFFLSRNLASSLRLSARSSAAKLEFRAWLKSWYHQFTLVSERFSALCGDDDSDSDSECIIS